MKTKLNETKSELKAQAQTIKTLKAKRKWSSCGHVQGLFSEQWHFRHKHVAYCLTRGRKMEEIERKVNLGNELSKSLLESYLEEYHSEEETVRACG